MGPPAILIMADLVTVGHMSIVILLATCYRDPCLKQMFLQFYLIQDTPKCENGVGWWWLKVFCLTCKGEDEIWFYLEEKKGGGGTLFLSNV